MRVSLFSSACALSCALLLSGCGIGTLDTTQATVKGAAIQGVVYGGRQPISGSKVYLMEAGTGYISHYTQSTLGTGYGFNDPYGLTLDVNGNVYIADYANNAVEEIPLSCINGANNASCVVTLGSGFQGPEGVAVDKSGNVFVADTYHNLVKEIVAVNGSIPASPTINTLGSGSVPHTFNLPYGIAVDGSGNVYVAENSGVDEISLSCINGANDSTCMTTLGGGFNGPESITLDRSGNVYVSDTNNNAVKKIPLSCINGANNASCVVTLGGGFSFPYTVAVDATGNVYVSTPFGGNLIKEIPLSCINGANNAGCVVTLFSGFNNPEGVTLDANGNVYITNSNNNQVIMETLSYTNQPTKSLLTAGDGSDALGTYVLSNGSGGFSINGNYTCDANAQSYLYITGGDSGSGTNSAISLMAVLGQCPASGTLTYAAQDPFVVINEVTTVAAAYAMAGYATDSTHVSSNNNSLATTGIANAFANAGNLVTLATGGANTKAPSNTNSIVPQAEINTLGNILAACVNSSSPSSSACSTLFTNAKSSGSTGTTATDVATAAINIAHNPGNAITALYGLQPGVSAPYAPHLSSAPNDFTVALNFSGGGLNGPFFLAIDASGNVWVTDNGTDNVSEFSSTGFPLSGSTGYTGTGMDYAYGISIDASGNAWAVGAFSSTLCKLSPSGTVLSGTGYTGGGIGQPTGTAIDSAGNIWTASDGGSLAQFSSSGSPLSGSGYHGGGLSDNRNIAFDISGNIWAANQGTTTISKLSSTGVPISSSSGYTGGGVNSPFGIGIDNLGNVWTANQANNSISKFSYSGVAVSGSSGYTGGGLNTPIGLAIDGSNNVWIANAGTNTISEFNSSGTAISPSTAYQGGSLSALHALAVDGSGNVWVPNYNGNSVTEFVGAATPVVTPLVANLIAPYGGHAANVP